MVLVKPADGRLVVLHADGEGFLLRASLTIGRVCIVMPSYISASDQQDVTLSNRRPLILQRLFDLGDRDLVSSHWTRRRAMLMLIPAHPITQNAASNNTASLTPIVDPICLTLRSLVMRQTVIIAPAFLMREVFQTIPLRAGLGVDVDLVVEGGEAEGCEIDDFLVEFFASEAGELHVVEGPVELQV